MMPASVSGYLVHFCIFKRGLPNCILDCKDCMHGTALESESGEIFAFVVRYGQCNEM